jgi:hypothetical protein
LANATHVIVYDHHVDYLFLAKLVTIFIFVEKCSHNGLALDISPRAVRLDAFHEISHTPGKAMKASL